MTTISLSEKNIEIIQSIIETDVTQIAEDISFFQELNKNPKEFIDEMIDLCEKFNLDFWSIIEINCSHFHFKQLQALYDDKNMKDFISTYEELSKEESAKDFLKIILRIKTNKMK